MKVKLNPYICDIKIISLNLIIMDTRELVYKGFKMNGFLALFLHLVVLTGAAVACFLPGFIALYSRIYSFVYSRCIVYFGMVDILGRIYAVGT